ncbi:MAG: adenylate/guanylate cyclase domain-containing protein [Leptospiraceae bacterium]|nr:adenylate/guanylate cyclase domain-containing protein [Leptospiraceae bacterium]
MFSFFYNLPGKVRNNSRYSIPMSLTILAIIGTYINIYFFSIYFDSFDAKLSSFLLFITFVWSGPLAWMIYIYREKDVSIVIGKLKRNLPIDSDQLEITKRKFRRRPLFGMRLIFIVWLISSLINSLLNLHFEAITRDEFWVYLMVCNLNNPLFSLMSYMMVEFLSRNEMRTLQIDIELSKPVLSLFSKIFFSQVFFTSSLFLMILILFNKSLNLSFKANSSELLELMRGTGTIIFLMALLFLFLNFLISRSIIDPVLSLAKNMNKISVGEIDTFSPVISTDEIGVLTKNFNLMSRGLQERETMKKIFGHYVSSDLRDLFMGVELYANGKEINASILLIKIKNFEKISHSLEPDELVKILNLFYSVTQSVVRSHGGMVDKFLSNQIWVAFGVPRSLGNHAENAILAAEEMIPRIQSVIQKNLRIQNLTIDLRITIHTGNVVMGNLGSENRKEFSIFGESLSLVQELDTHPKLPSNSILFTESTHILFGKGDFLEEVNSKQHKDPVRLYSLPPSDPQKILS